MKELTLADLLQAGAHFGHKSSRWSPKMKPYIYGHRNNIHIFDLEKTKNKMADALNFLKEVAARGGTVLFVGTKKQAKAAVKAAAESAGMPYVTERWLGGTFTNFRTVQKSMRKMEKLASLKESDEISAYTKKERLLMERELQKLNRLFSGLEKMKSMPDAIFVFSTHHDDIAVHEANKMKIPVVGVVDSNADPDRINYVIPGNDDSVQAITLYANAAAEAVIEGRKNMVIATPQVDKAPAKAAPVAQTAEKV